MGENTKNEAPKKSWFTGLQAEFNKIIWPEKKSLGKQTAAVIAVCVVVGVIIAVLDFGIQHGIDFLVNL